MPVSMNAFQSAGAELRNAASAAFLTSMCRGWASSGVVSSWRMKLSSDSDSQLSGARIASAAAAFCLACLAASRRASSSFSCLAFSMASRWSWMCSGKIVVVMNVFHAAASPPHAVTAPSLTFGPVERRHTW
jgi:hypothetical protein